MSRRASGRVEPPRPPGSLFTSTQRDQFTRFSTPDERTLSQYYLLDGADLQLVRERRRDFNKLGFAVQLTVLRHLGRALRPGETPPEVMLAYLAEQLRVEPACYWRYAAREPTRREHFAAVCQRLGYNELSRRQGAER